MIFKELVKLNIPDVVLNNKVSMDLIDIVLDYVEQNSMLSYDISKVYTSNNQALKEEFVNTYLENIASAFNKAMFDQNINDKLQQIYSSIGMVYDPYSVPNIADVFTDEYLNVSKNFKQRKGTVPGIQFAYNAIRNSKIQGVNISQELTDATFSVELGTAENPEEPFMFRVQGSLYEEIYENVVKAIVHPVGFGYMYAKIVAILFTEYVLVSLEYQNTLIKVKCSNGGIIEDYSTKSVKFIGEESDNNARVKTTVTFSDNTYLVKDFNTTVTYYNADGSINKKYSDDCALFLSYTLKLTSDITDNIDMFEIQCEASDSYIFGGLTGGGGNNIGNITIGSFIIGASQAEVFNVEFEYFENNLFLKVIFLEQSPIIGANNVTIGNSIWKVGQDGLVLEEASDDNYFVIEEISEDFLFEIIPV